MLNDKIHLKEPAALQCIKEATHALGFKMASDSLTGSLLRTLAASKTSGHFLELGTGTGLATAWILDGMDRSSRLISVDNDVTLLGVARQHLGHDPRVVFHCAEGAQFLETTNSRRFDLIFADTWPGKYTHLDQALDRLRPGGFYVIDDMLPQPSWPEDHAPKVPLLIQTLEARQDLILTKMAWSTGVIVAVKRS